MVIDFNYASSEDVEEIVCLFKKAIVHMERSEIFQWDGAYPTQEHIIKDINEEYLQVGRIDGRIAVVYTLNQECDEEYVVGSWSKDTHAYSVIHRLAVHPDYQGVGIAKVTMEYIHTQLRTAGMESVRLDAFTQNPYAVKLYTKCGYNIVGEVAFRKGSFYLMEKVF